MKITKKRLRELIKEELFKEANIGAATGASDFSRWHAGDEFSDESDNAYVPDSPEERAVMGGSAEFKKFLEAAGINPDYDSILNSLIELGLEPKQARQYALFAADSFGSTEIVNDEPHINLDEKKKIYEVYTTDVEKNIRKIRDTMFNKYHNQLKQITTEYLNNLSNALVNKKVKTDHGIGVITNIKNDKRNIHEIELEVSLPNIGINSYYIEEVELV